MHRDIKPANILLDESGNAYLTDFGIATLAGSFLSQIELQLEEQQKEYYSGSLGYQSPEMASGDPVTQLADIYSLGVVLYQLVTARKPFPNLSGDELIQAHRTKPVPSVLALRPELPPAVDDVIQKATAKEPTSRYPDALQLAAAFKQAILAEAPEVLPEMPLEAENPYKGLRAFQEADAGEFFGREAMVQRLVRRFDEEDGDSSQGRFLAVVGPSGSGKSSLVRAGLVPALRRGRVPGSDDWFIVDMIPGAHPFEELEAALLRVAVNPPESLLGQLQEDDYWINDLAWSPDSDRLAVIAQDKVSEEPCETVILDTTSGETLLTLTGHESAARSLDWSPDGTTILIAHEDGTARLWDADTGMERLRLTGHTGVVRDAVFSPDGNRIASASEDGTVRIWNAETGIERMVLSSHAGPVLSVAWSPDGARLVTGGNDGVPRVWDMASGDVLFVMPGHTEDVVIVTWSADGSRIASQSFDATVKVWDAATGGLIFQIPNAAPPDYHRGYVEFSPEGKWILTAGSRVLGTHLWDTSIPVPKLFGHTLGQEWGEWSPDGSLIATSGEDGSARLWDASTGEQIGEFDQGSFWSDWAPDGSRLVFAQGVAAHTLSVWDAFSGEKLASLSAPADEYGAHQFLTMDWSPDGSFINAGDFRPFTSQAIYVWDAETTELVTTIRTDDLCALGWPRWSPDSTKIAGGCIFVESGINTPARIWDAATGEELMRLESEYGWTFRTVWSPDGTQILTTHEHGVAIIWDTESGESILTFTGHQGQVDGEWSPDGTLIASTDYATQIVKIWDSKTGEELLSFSVPGAPLTINWSPDGTHVIITGDGMNEPVIKRVWASTEELIAHAYECCVSRELTPEERDQFGLPPRP